MTIKEVEELTGITKQNIRFYEKKGLVKPERNAENDYRNYSARDIEDILMIKMLRKLDMPMEEIRGILEKEISITEAVRQHGEKLREEENKLQAAIRMCQEIQKTDETQFRVEICLSRMDEIEKNGGRFMNIINDYKKVCEAEHAKMFSFVPNNMCMDPREFSIALCEYADENNLNLMITRESMYPEFEIDGVKYVGDRVFGRLGAVVRCTLADDAQTEVDKIPQDRRKSIKIVRKILGLLLVILLLVLFSGFDFMRFISLSITVVVIAAFYYPYRRLK